MTQQNINIIQCTGDKLYNEHGVLQKRFSIVLTRLVP